ncbi:hypothetical protein BDD12DRAFT_819368 [Trichophaea hybrida]|nr:hypothetical protein BDD12DRAFT_819368 [Trichophaea hybrida]
MGWDALSVAFSLSARWPFQSSCTCRMQVRCNKMGTTVRSAQLRSHRLYSLQTSGGCC